MERLLTTIKGDTHMNKQINVGDRVKFKCKWARWQCNTETRIVNGVLSNGDITVRYAGWSHFVVHRHEIKEVLKKGE